MPPKITALTDRERVVARLRCKGLAQKQISAATGLSYGAVHRILRTPRVRAHVASLHDEADRALVHWLAIGLYMELMGDRNR